MSPEELNQLLTARSEHERLEFKEAKRSYEFKNLVEYCVALANEGGGRIVLGVTDKKPRQVVGTQAFNVPEKTVAGLHERLRLKITCKEIAHPQGRVLVFQVPSRPTGQPIHYKGRYLMRAGEELVGMSPDQLKTIMAEDSPEWSAAPAKVNCGGDEVVSLLDTQTYFDLLNLPYPSTREAVLERLAGEKLIEAKGEGWTITNLGAILFAKRLDSFGPLARKAPRVIMYEGKSKLKTRTDQIGEKGYAVGFKGLVEHISNLVPANEVIEQAIRREMKMFPDIAIRELAANALIHQDFTESGASVMIEVYDDRLEISNPGLPTIPTERFIDEYRSRNETLAGLMRRLGICEEKGSGVDKVIDAAEVFQLPAPDFREGAHRTTAVLFAHQDLEDMQKPDRIRACYQHCCLRYVMNERMTNQSLRDRFNVPASRIATISTIITHTLDTGKIKLADPDQISTRYRSYIPYWA